MNSITVGIIGIAVMLLLLFMGMNIALSFALIGFIGYAMLVTPEAAFGLFRTAFYSAAGNYSYSVIPLFILMGEFAFRSGLSAGLYNLGNKWLSRLPGGLACATIAASAFFGAICGSLAATTATMGTISIPEMRKYKYDDKLSCGAIAAGGTLGVLIPPSTTFILYGIASGTSIGALFMCGVIPGILCAVLMIVTVVIWCKLKPGIAPQTQSYSWKERFLAFKDLIGVIVLFLFVFGGMFGGLFTVNEAAGAGAFGAFILMILRRQCTKKNVFDSVKNTIKSSCMVYLVLMGANMLNAFISITKIPVVLADYITGLEVSKYILFAGIVLIYMFLGCIMDGMAVIVLTVPIFLPIVTQLGFDPIWFGCIITLTAQIGGITPPVGISCYVLSGVVKDVSLQKIFRGIVPFIFTLLVTIFLVTIFPDLVMWLPRALGAA